MDRATQDRVVGLIQTGRADAALLVLSRHVQDQPRDWYALYLSGVASRALGSLDQAIAFLAKSIAVRPTEASVHLALGIALQLDEQFDSAVDSLLAAIRLKPDLFEAYNSLGLTYKKQGRYKHALETYEQGIERLMASVSAVVHSDESRCYTEEIVDGKRIRTVLPYVLMKTREMLRANPLYAIFTNNVGVCFEEIGQLDEARVHFAEAVELTPDGYNYPDPLLNLRRLGRTNM